MGRRRGQSATGLILSVCIAIASVACTIDSDGDNRAITTNSFLSPVCITTEAQKVCEDAPGQEIVTVEYTLRAKTSRASATGGLTSAG
jgi:hypothetical protein